MFLSDRLLKEEQNLPKNERNEMSLKKRKSIDLKIIKDVLEDHN